MIGAGVENPEDLAPLRPFLSSRKIFIIFDNVESILDPEGTDSEEILAAVDELCQFDQICVCTLLASRHSLSTASIRRSPHRRLKPLGISFTEYTAITNNPASSTTLLCLKFHALSIALLATTAAHNKWGYDRLVNEWNAHRAKVLQTDTNKSLTASLQLSLDSPTFLKLGSDARGLLGVIAFFPQDVGARKVALAAQLSRDLPFPPNLFAGKPP